MIPQGEKAYQTPPSSVLLQEICMIEIKECHFEAFTVIGLVGDDSAGPGFIGKLWQDINTKGKSIMHLAKKDEDGQIMGAWGLMNDETLSFLPPGQKSAKTIYMAGIETEDNARPPKGFTKWVVPESDYLYAPAGQNKLDTIKSILRYAGENEWVPASCAFDFMPPDSNGEKYLFLPVKKA